MIGAKAVRRCALTTVALVLAAGLVRAQTPPYGLVAKGKYKKVSPPDNSFEVQYPDSKDWKVIPGHPASLVTIAETKNGSATIILERSTLRGALTPDELVFAAQSEAATVRGRQPEVSNLQQQVLDRDGRRFVAIQYVRPGLKGPEQIVQYAFPIGTTMYRLVCSALQSSFGTYSVVFGHAAASFRAPAAPAK